MSTIYTLAQIKQGSGFPRGIRFAVVEDEPRPATVHYLTVDDDEGITTTLHPSDEALAASLRENYLPDDDSVSDDDLVQHLIDTQGLVIYIDEVELSWAVER